MTEAEWRFLHGVGPEPRIQPLPDRHQPDRDRIYHIPDKDLVVVRDSPMGTGLDTWDF